MASTIQRLVDDIGNLAVSARPSDIMTATILMNACQSEEYAMAKHTLNQLDSKDLTPRTVVKQLRAVEQDVRLDAANATRVGQGGRPSLRGRGSGLGTGCVSSNNNAG